MKKIKLMCIVSVLCFFTACSFAPNSEPAPISFVLQDDEKELALPKIAKGEKIIKIMPSQSLFYLKSNEIIYLKDGEFGTYAKHFWKYSPVESFEMILAHKFERSQIFKAVLNQNSQITADYVLESKMYAFEQVFEEDKNYVRLELSAHLIKTQDNSLVANKYFSYKIPVEKVEPQAAAAAFDIALNRLSDDVVLWISKNIK